MTREEFIARLEEVGFRNDFIVYGRDVYSFELKYQIEYIRIALPVNNNYDVFINLHPYELYGFNELEQFLIDKGIVDKEFDPFEYLLSREDFIHTQEHRIIGDMFVKGEYKLFNKTFNDTLEVEGPGFEIIFESNSKKSIDKAIKLIDFLIELEKDNN